MSIINISALRFDPHTHPYTQQLFQMWLIYVNTQGERGSILLSSKSSCGLELTVTLASVLRL